MNNLLLTDANDKFHYFIAKHKSTVSILLLST